MTVYILSSEHSVHSVWSSAELALAEADRVKARNQHDDIEWAWEIIAARIDVSEDPRTECVGYVREVVGINKDEETT